MYLKKIVFVFLLICFKNFVFSGTNTNNNQKINAEVSLNQLMTFVDLNMSEIILRHPESQSASVRNSSTAFYIEILELDIEPTFFLKSFSSNNTNYESIKNEKSVREIDYTGIFIHEKTDKKTNKKTKKKNILYQFFNPFQLFSLENELVQEKYILTEIEDSRKAFIKKFKKNKTNVWVILPPLRKAKEDGNCMQLFIYYN